MRFDSTHIYQRSMELVELSKVVLDELPVGFGFLADQLRRAASSIALNFAEGYGKQSQRDQRRFYVIARGSACEVAAILDVGFRFGVVASEKHSVGRDLCDQLARMLSCFHRTT